MKLLLPDVNLEVIRMRFLLLHLMSFVFFLQNLHVSVILRVSADISLPLGIINGEMCVLVYCSLSRINNT